MLCPTKKDAREKDSKNGCDLFHKQITKIMTYVKKKRQELKTTETAGVLELELFFYSSSCPLLHWKYTLHCCHGQKRFVCIHRDCQYFTFLVSY